MPVLFQNSYEARPQFRNRGGSFLEWRLPESGLRTVLFSGGMGDGIFSGYWGLDAEGEAVCLTVPFKRGAWGRTAHRHLTKMSHQTAEMSPDSMSLHFAVLYT